MKIVALILVMSLCAGSVFAWNDYSNAYEEGYGDGATYNEPFAIRPISPIAPIARLGETTESMRYRGFLDGLSER